MSFNFPQKLAVGLLSLLVVGVLVFKFAQHNSDGPLNDMIPGGKLRSGELVEGPADGWWFAHGETVEFELQGPGTSRWVGAQVHNGSLYIPCDLGYMWGRMDGGIRNVLHLIYLFKNWHKKVLEDDRVVVRLKGKRYPLRASRVTDPSEIAALKSNLEQLARGWMAPEPLGEPPTDGPRDIWFFRLVGPASTDS